MEQNDTEYRLAELERRLNNIIRVFTIIELDEVNRVIRLESGENKTDWLPWPASTGRNFVNWRPLKKGQQMVLGSVGGDLSQALIIGEIYSDEVLPPREDKAVDIVRFSNGDFVERNSDTGKAKIVIAGGLEIKGGSSTILIDNAGVRVTGKEIYLN